MPQSDGGTGRARPPPADVANRLMAGLSGLGLGRLVRHVGTTLVQQLSTRLLQLLIAVYLAHTLGVQDFGRYTIAILWPSVLAQLLSLGLPAASVYAFRGGSLKQRKPRPFLKPRQN